MVLPTELLQVIFRKKYKFMISDTLINVYLIALTKIRTFEILNNE